MKLYHATEYENKQSIEENGLWPTDCGSKFNNGNTLQGKGHIGIYGFTTIEDAIDFASENAYETVIFEFEANETIDDPEFNGNAKFFETETPAAAKIVYNIYA